MKSNGRFMALVYYDIFAFFLLLFVGALIEEKKKAIVTLLILSLLLISISAYFFFTNYVLFENEIFIGHGPGRLPAIEKPYSLFVAYFLIIWLAYYCFSFLTSRALRLMYPNFLKVFGHGHHQENK